MSGIGVFIAICVAAALFMIRFLFALEAEKDLDRRGYNASAKLTSSNSWDRSTNQFPEWEHSSSSVPIHHVFKEREQASNPYNLVRPELRKRYKEVA